MAGEGAAKFGPLHQCSWQTETGALVLERGPVLTLGVEAAPAMKGSSSTKRKAEVAALPTEDQPVDSRRKAEEPAAGCVKGEKPSDVVSAAAGGEDGAAKAAAGEDEEPLVPGMILESGAVVDEELIEHLEWVKTLNLPPIETLIPGLVFSNRRSDLYGESSSDEEEEEEGEEAVQELNTN